MKRIAVKRHDGFYQICVVVNWIGGYVPFEIAFPNGAVVDYWKTSPGGFFYFKEKEYDA